MHCVKVIGLEGRSICYIFWFIFKDFFSFPTEIKNDLETKNIPQAGWEETHFPGYLSANSPSKRQKLLHWALLIYTHNLISK